MSLEISEAHVRSNIHPAYRSFGLDHLRQVRRMLREGRYEIDCRRIIKRTQRSLLSQRRALAAARAELAR